MSSYDNQMYAQQWPPAQMQQEGQHNVPMQTDFYPPVSDPMYDMTQPPGHYVQPDFVQPGMRMDGQGFYPQQQPVPQDPSMVAMQPMPYNVVHQAPQHVPQQVPQQVPQKGKGREKPCANKRRRKNEDHKSDEDSPDNDEECNEHKGKSGFLRLPDVIDKLASEKQVLVFDNDSQLYVVKDGPGFEAQFNELRYTRGKKSEGASNRPFSRMHTYFVLVRGERWAGTGSAFKAKDAAKVVPPGDMVQAANINVTLMPSNETTGFQVTLQHFLNVTGAGDLYRKAKLKMGEKQESKKDVKAEAEAQDSASTSWPSSSEACSPGSPASAEDFFDHYESDTVLDGANISQVLGNIWTADSKGDQGYFFRRHDDHAPFANGAIVMLEDGQLVADTKPRPNSMYMVVSDKNVKWKGEPIPTPEEERSGHWCCFLGQVPVVVEGPIRSGEYVGPKADGSGRGVAARLGEAPVVGIALSSKEGEEAGVVKTMCFAGLNAMSRGFSEDFTKVFEQAKQTQKQLEAVRSDVAKVEGKMDITEDNMLNLSQRLARMERRLMGVFHHQPAVVPGLPVNDGDWRLRRQHSQQQLRPGLACWFRRNRLCVGILMGIALTLTVVVGLVARARRNRPPPPPAFPPGRDVFADRISDRIADRISSGGVADGNRRAHPGGGVKQAELREELWEGAAQLGKPWLPPADWTR